MFENFKKRRAIEELKKTQKQLSDLKNGEGKELEEMKKNIDEIRSKIELQQTKEESSETKKEEETFSPEETEEIKKSAQDFESTVADQENLAEQYNVSWVNKENKVTSGITENVPEQKTEPENKTAQTEKEKELAVLNDLYKYNLELGKQRYNNEEELRQDREEKKEWYNEERAKIIEKYNKSLENMKNGTPNLEEQKQETEKGTERKMETENELEKTDYMAVDINGRPQAVPIPKENIKTTEKEPLLDEKETAIERKFDVQKVSEEINQKITEIEKQKGTLLTPEEKQNMALEMFLKTKENFQKETIENHGWLKRHLEKSQEWWKNLDDSRWGKVTKVAMSTAFLGSTTLLSGSVLGIAPSGSFVNKLASRIGIATGLNMAITSNLTGKFLSAFKKEGGSEGEEGKFKKLINKVGIGNIASIGGIGTSFILSGGTVALVGAGGFVARKAFNAYFDKKIKEAEEYKQDSSKYLQNFDINTLEKGLSSFESQYSQATKEIEKYKRWRGVLNGAATIGVGLGTMAVMHHNIDEKINETKSTNFKGTQEEWMKKIIPEKNIGAADKLTHEFDKFKTPLNSEGIEVKVSGPNEQTAQEWMEQTLPKKNVDAVSKLTEEFKGFEGPSGSEENIGGKGSGSSQQIIEGLKQKIEEKIEFSSKGAIQTIENLKAQIHHDYPDISKAPHSVQEFVKTDSVKEAIKLGFYNPDNPSGTESASIMKGSTLEFDKNGNLLFHDMKTGESHTLINEQNDTETIEKYHGKMFDSDQSAKIIDEQRLKELEDYEKSFETHSMSEDGQNGTEHLDGSKKAIEYEDTSKKVAKYEDTSKMTTNSLHETELSTQVAKAYKDSIRYLIAKDTKGNILDMLHSTKYTAADLLKEETDNINPLYKPLVEYLHALKDITGLKPKEAGWFRTAETNEEYIKRAIEEAAKKGKLVM